MFYSAQSEAVIDHIIAPFHINADADMERTKLVMLSDKEIGACVEYADANGLLGLFASRLEEMGCISQFPADTYDTLNRALQEGERKDRQHQLDAIAVTSSLQDAGILCLVLKGTALAYLLYQKAGVRPTRDLDLLIEPGRVNEAGEVLKQLGFSAIPNAHEPDHHLPRMIRPRSDGTIFAIDTHHRLVPPRIYGIRVDEWDGLWERSRWIDAGEDHKIRTLSYEDHVLHLHVHLFHHLFYNFRLMHLIDIVFAARAWRELLDWNRVADQLQQIGLSQFRSDLWFWITTHFGDALPYQDGSIDDKAIKISRWLLRHGSLPIFAGPRYSKSRLEWLLSLSSEFRRYAYRSFKAPGWGLLYSNGK